MEDGDILQLAPGEPEITGSAPVGKLVADGNRLVRLDGAVMGARRKMLFNGVVLASLAMDSGGKVRGTPQITAPGLFDEEDGELARVTDQFISNINDMPMAMRRDEENFPEAARTALRRALGRRLDKRPIVDVHLIRV